MPELVDKAKVLKYLTPRIKTETPYGEGYNRALEDAAELVTLMPTIEAEPVRHGRWINDTFCSECKRFPVDVSVSISNQELTKYFSRCPHCGAQMDGGEAP